jgi:hypothetical protein
MRRKFAHLGVRVMTGDNHRLSSKQLTFVRVKLKDIYLFFDEIDFTLSGIREQKNNLKAVRELMSRVQSLALHFQLLKNGG